jgi:hypothetical protein
MKKIAVICTMVLAAIALLNTSNALAQINPENKTVTAGTSMLASPFIDFQIYLPIVLKPPQGTILFPNGDFEQGPVIWSQYSSSGWLLITEVFIPGVSPYDGTWAAWLGGSPGEISYIVQQILVPHGYPYMSYWYWIDSEDECGNDVGQVFVNGDLVDAYSLCYPNNTGGWVNRVVDLYAYTGNSVSITIMAACDETYNSRLFIDHVAFKTR